MVQILSNIPDWFIQLSILIELIITAISLSVAYAALKIYSLCKEREIKFFGIGFLLISISYIFWSVLNLVFMSKLRSGPYDFPLIAKFSAGLLWAYFFLFIIGLATLVFMTLKVKGKRAYLIILVLSISPLLLYGNPAWAFSIVTLILLFFITAYYGAAWFARRKTRRLISFIAFSLIFVGRIVILFASKNYFNYIAGNLAEFVAYLLLLLNMVFVMKNGKKKKQARNY